MSPYPRKRPFHFAQDSNRIGDRSRGAWCFRVARRMLRTSVSDDAGVELDFCLIFAP